MPRPDRVPPPAVTLLEADFGDAELVVKEHADGMVTIDLDDTRLLVNEAQFQTIVGGFAKIGKEKGWL